MKPMDHFELDKLMPGVCLTAVDGRKGGIIDIISDFNAKIFLQGLL